MGYSQTIHFRRISNCRSSFLGYRHFRTPPISFISFVAPAQLWGPAHRHYLKTYFLVDFLSTMPIDRVVEAGLGPRKTATVPEDLGKFYQYVPHKAVAEVSKIGNL